jgi:hypothetical protein
MRKYTPWRNLTQVRSTGQVAIILANSLPWSRWFEPTLARVGTLPVLLRAILGVKATHVQRIIVVHDGVMGSQIRQDLLNTRRLPAGIEWMEVAVGTTLSTIVRMATAHSGEARVLLVAGDRTYQPALHRLVSDWESQCNALALATGSEPVGLFALSHEAALRLCSDIEPDVVTVQDLHRWITQQAIVHGPSFVDLRLVDEDSWQQVSLPQDSIAAEQKLNRWLVKPTDGVFARMNRRISIPITRQLIKYPITPIWSVCLRWASVLQRVRRTQWVATGTLFLGRSCRCGPAFLMVAMEKSPG